MVKKIEQLLRNSSLIKSGTLIGSRLLPATEVLHEDPKKFFHHRQARNSMLRLDQGYSIQEACDAVGVDLTATNCRVHQPDSERRGNTPTHSRAMTPDQQRIYELEAKITTALLDRLTHHCHIVETGNDS